MPDIVNVYKYQSYKQHKLLFDTSGGQKSKSKSKVKVLVSLIPSGEP